MDVQAHPSAIQVGASKFLKKVSHIRPKFKLRTRSLLRDDNDLHPYSQRHKRIKSEAVRGAATGGASLDTESGTDNTLKPYMSQPLLNLNEMVVEPFVPDVIRHVDDQRRTKISGLPCEAEEAEASLLHVARSYDVHHPLSSERPKPPVQPVSAVRFPAPTSTITSGEGDSLNTTQNQRGSFTGPAANVTTSSKRTARKKQDICDDDVPLMVLKERVGGHRPPASDNSESGVGPPKSTTLQSRAPGIVVSYSEGTGHGGGKASSIGPTISSYRNDSNKQQNRDLPPLPRADTADTLPADSMMAGLASLRPRFMPFAPPGGSPSGESTRLNPMPLSPLTIPARLSRRISVDKSGNTLRFSPSIVTRHPPLPLKLPPLPPVSPARETTDSQDLSNRKRDSRIGLRSMPALPHGGSGQGAGGHEEEDEGADDDVDGDTEEGEDSISQGDDQSPATTQTDHAGSESSMISQLGATSFTTVWGEVTRQFPEPISLGSKNLNLPKVDTSRLDLSFFDRALTPISDTKGKGKAREDLVDNGPTPTDHIRVDYFATSNEVAEGSSIALSPSKKLSTSWSKMPLSAQRRISSSALRTTQPVKTLPLPPLVDVKRPGIYKHASQSMVDIHILKPIEEPGKHDDRPKGDYFGAEGGREVILDEGIKQKMSGGAGPLEEVPPSPKILRRRRSLPSYYGPSSPPPPYPTFSPFPRGISVQPREDEGREKLPTYCNDIYLRAIIPRKMEFSKPSVQARDRKWRRVICVLEGTVLRIYRCPPKVAGLSRIGGWWEKQVGVGDSSSSTSYVTATSIIHGPEGQERQPVTATVTGNKHGEQGRPSVTIRPHERSISPPEPKRSGLVPFLRATKKHTRSNSETSPAMVNNTLPRSARPSLNLPRTPLSGNSVSSRAPSPGPSMLLANSSTAVTSPERPTTPLSMSGEEVPEPRPSDLIRSYTLQHAECGLGLDYNKRKNVIRVKVEGEQFLLQPKDAMEVIGWIEGIQAGTNVALDLDERMMPRGPLFPRRRRRRRG